jgi:hypothetical protein
MSQGGLSITLRDSAGPKMRSLITSLDSSGRARLNRWIGTDEQLLVRDHFLALQGSRHASASRLGAQPTNYWGKAAESVSQADALSAGAESAVVSIAAPGIVRAVRDVDIHPTGGRQYLSIPIASEAYGNRMLKGEGSRFPKGFFITSKKGNLLFVERVGEGKTAQLHPLYLMKPSVHQPQDRTLLPSDAQILNTARKATGEFFTAALGEVNQAVEERRGE